MIPEKIRDKARFILVQKKGKMPIEKNWQNENNYSFDEPKLLNWLEKGGNYGVIPKDDLCIIDIDEPQKLNGVTDIFKDTFTVQTNQGFHYYICVPNSEGKKVPFYDLKTKEHLGEFYTAGCNGFCVGANSIHPNGKTYKIINDAPLKKFSVYDINCQFFDKVMTSKKKPPQIKSEQIEIKKTTKVDWTTKATEGERNNRLTQIAGNLLFLQHIPFEMALLTMQEWNLNYCEPPLSKEEVERTAKSIYESEKENKNRFKAFTELGNAEKFIDLYENKVIFDVHTKKWLIWDGKRWKYDETFLIEKLYQQMITKMKKESAFIDDEKLQTKYLTHINRSQSYNFMQGSLKHAKVFVSIENEKLNRNPFLFNMQNGILDLKNESLHEHTQEFLLTRISPSKFEESSCPMWLDFINKIFNGNQDLIDFVQRAVGYSLSGSTSERCLFILYGTGKNGKTVFLETLEKFVFGEYAKRTNSETFMKQTNTGTIRNDLARLQGARFVYAGEGNEARRLDEGIVKEITGGDKISARYLYSEYFEFRPEFKVWFATNHKPTITGSDNAVWERIKLIPFKVIIKEEEKIEQDVLYSIFENEKEGIFMWAYEGFLKWYNMGFNKCTDLEDSIKIYREDMDYLENFIQDCCELTNPKTDIGFPTKFLYEAFVEWWTEEEQSHYKPISKKMFSMKLQDKGFERVMRRDTDGTMFRGFKGISLR